MAARKARKLPFVVEPRLQPIMERIGSEESGQIEIRRQGYLTVSEKSWVQGAEAGTDVTSKVHRLALRIAAETGVEPQEVLDKISKGQVDGSLAAYGDEIMEILSEVALFGDRHDIIAATCLMISRVDSKWEVEDTMALHIDIVKGLSKLYSEEERKTLDALEAAVSEKEIETESKTTELGKD